MVQHMLGHASAAMPLDQYGHPLGDRLDQVAEAMRAARAAAPYPVCTSDPMGHDVSTLAGPQRGY